MSDHPGAAPAADVVPQHRLRVGQSRFWCPYCGTTWERGGHKEGFVKSGANNHVYACWEVVLFLRGFVAVGQTGGYSGSGKLVAVPLAEAEPRHVRAVRSLLASRRRAGLNPQLPEAL